MKLVSTLPVRLRRTHLPAALFLIVVFAAGEPRAFAVSKEIIQLQTQIQQLQEAVARLQQSNDERMGVLKDLVQQTTDSVNRMTVNVDALQKQVHTQTEGSVGKIDTVSTQVQSLNDSIDEVKARLARIEKSMADVQSSQQSINARMESGSSGMTTAPAPADSTPVRNPRSAPTPAAPATAPSTKPSAATALPTNPAAPPVEDLYRTAYGDFNGAKYALASAEFNDIIKLYPDSNFAGNSYFYLGEIEYRAEKYTAAARNYDKVIEQYPGNPKVAVAQLRKGESLLALKQTDAGARELRSLIQRFPTSQEATTARSRLNALGITVTPRRPAAER